MVPLWQTLRRSFIDAYDRLGLVITSSLTVSGILLLALAVVPKLARINLIAAGLWAVFICVFVASPLIAGEFYLARRIVALEDTSFADLFRGARCFLFRSWALGAVQALISLMLLVNIWFYMTRGMLPAKVLSVVFVYLLVFWAMSAVYHYPVMVEQGSGVFKTLKRGFLLTLDNLAFTAGLFFAIIVLACLCGVLVVGMVLLYPGVASLLQTRALRGLFVKYGLLKEPVYIDPDEFDPGIGGLDAVESVGAEPPRSVD